MAFMRCATHPGPVFLAALSCYLMCCPKLSANLSSLRSDHYTPSSRIRRRTQRRMQPYTDRCVHMKIAPHGAVKTAKTRDFKDSKMDFVLLFTSSSAKCYRPAFRCKLRRHLTGRFRSTSHHLPCE
uniref:Secreted protein n=1 Tax=Anopheles maculatus TaxID=74869 RepID=A0A182T879_9DIPT